MTMAKPLLVALYASKTLPDHEFPLHICMCLVPELGAILNMKEQQNSKSCMHARIHGYWGNWSKSRCGKLNNWMTKVITLDYCLQCHDDSMLPDKQKVHIVPHH